MQLRIVLEPSDYTYYNVGDVATLQAAISRLAALSPAACIQVLTEDSAGLAKHCPRAEPLPKTSRTRGRLMSVLGRYMLRRAPEPSEELCGAIAQADLVCVAGMGGITDWFEEYALELLGTVACAIRRGKRTALFSQGIGPIHSRRLLARARDVLPQVDLIALRERRLGEPLLRSLGVPPQRILITGDDALELAYDNRAECLGRGLGINVRRGWYAEVDAGLINQLRPVLQQAAHKRSAPLVPVPISNTPGEEDCVTIRQLTAGFPDVVDSNVDPDSPLGVIRQLQYCRVLITGSYHAGVFALAQGVPTIGLARSSYYAAKFGGLADLFGAGTEVVVIDDGLASTLTAAVDRLWDSADQLRPGLLHASATQIEMGRAAYRRIADVLAAN